MLLTLGDFRYHTVDGAQAAGMPADRTIACRDAEDVITLLRRTVRPGDAVLIKGSRAMAMERITQVLSWQPAQKAA
jgi:UDP-N-acetylmuramoyl-tripeptide--D-alanyl-D-alanine ligase